MQVLTSGKMFRTLRYINDVVSLLLNVIVPCFLQIGAFIVCNFFWIVFGMLLGDTLILDDLDSANAYRQEVDTIYMYNVTTHRLCSKLCMLELICMY